MMKKFLPWTFDDLQLEGALVYDDTVKTPRPGLLMIPNWFGVTEAAVRQALEVAGQQYVMFVADMYDVSARPKNSDEASQAINDLKADFTLLRARANKALEVLREQAKTAPIDVTKLGAIGFCFGGTVVLELARSGAHLAGAVSFHGGLASLHPQGSPPAKARILALHGSDDPLVPPEEVRAFVDEMCTSKTDWHLVSFAGAVHSFSDPSANIPGSAQYHPQVARRAFRLMHDFFGNIFLN